MCGQFQGVAELHWGKSTWYPLSIGLIGAEGRFGCHGKDKDSACTGSHILVFLLTLVLHVKEHMYCIKQFCLSCSESRQACFIMLHELFCIVLSVAIPVICGICMYVPPLCFCLSYKCFFVNEDTVKVPVHVIKACGWQWYSPTHS